MHFRIDTKKFEALLDVIITRTLKHAPSRLPVKRRPKHWDCGAANVSSSANPEYRLRTSHALGSFNIERSGKVKRATCRVGA